MKKLTVGIVGILILLCSSVTFSQTNSIKITVELNTAKEYVLIKNEGESPVNLKGWVLHDHDYGKANVFSYTFDEITLQPEYVLQMQSGKKKEDKADDDEKANKREGSTYYIRWSDRNVWNNTCDIAYLENNNGKLIAESHEGTKKDKDSCR